MRYYSTQRPVMPGSYPRSYSVKEIHNFEQKTFCEEIGREAWGYIEFEVSIPEDEATHWELTMAGKKIYWGVTTSVYDNGRVVANITSTVEAVCKPGNTFQNKPHKDVYIDWFESREEAVKFVEGAKNA